MTNTRPSDSELIENLRIELRSGCLVLAALAELRVEHYGYTLRKQLSAQGLEVEENTLYPMLRRLEAQGLLTSEWREDERRKRFYKLSATGERVLEALLQEWDEIHRALQRIRRKEMKRSRSSITI